MTEKNIFPTIYSMLSESALLDTIKQHYTLTNIQQCQFLSQGINDTYLITTNNQKYILKIYHHQQRTIDDIDFELDFLLFLKKNTAAIAPPVPTKIGDLYFEIHAAEGTRYACLFYYADGFSPKNGLNQKQAYLLGYALATIHNLSMNFTTDTPAKYLDFNSLLHKPIECIQPFLKHRKDDLNYLINRAMTLQTNLGKLDTAAPYWVICIGDLHTGNIHFSNENQLTIFDFDQCGYCWRVFDIAKFLRFSIHTKIPNKVLQSFINGYQQINPLNEDEWNAIPDLISISFIWQLGINTVQEKILSQMKFTKSYLDSRMKILHELENLQLPVKPV